MQELVALLVDVEEEKEQEEVLKEILLETQSGHPLK